jgi:hypothetical protein
MGALFSFLESDPIVPSSPHVMTNEAARRQNAMTRPPTVSSYNARTEAEKQRRENAAEKTAREQKLKDEGKYGGGKRRPSRKSSRRTKKRRGTKRQVR